MSDDSAAQARARRQPWAMARAPGAASALVALAGCGSSSSSSTDQKKRRPRRTRPRPRRRARAPASGRPRAASCSLVSQPEGAARIQHQVADREGREGDDRLHQLLAGRSQRHDRILLRRRRVGATPTFEGGSKTLSLNLKPGTYKFFCSRPRPPPGRHGRHAHGPVAEPAAAGAGPTARWGRRGPVPLSRAR